LVARALELEGIATTLVAWNGGRIRLVAPPRAAITALPRGTAFGLPGDEAGQRYVLEATLALLEEDAPLKPVYLDKKRYKNQQ
jgi:hypothetical protein